MFEYHRRRRRLFDACLAKSFTQTCCSELFVQISRAMESLSTQFGPINLFPQSPGIFVDGRGKISLLSSNATMERQASAAELVLFRCYCHIVSQISLQRFYLTMLTKKLGLCCGEAYESKDINRVARSVNSSSVEATKRDMRRRFEICAVSLSCVKR